MDNKTTSGLGISSLCLLWGIVTQCLNWANIIQWPWYAIWGPTLFVVVVWILAFIIAIIIALIAGR